jgi:hypothetical protein
MMLLPRSRARFEAATASPSAASATSAASPSATAGAVSSTAAAGAAHPTASSGAPAAAFDDDADYAAFYKGKHAFECVRWSAGGEIRGMGCEAAGYEQDEDYGPVPAGILDDHAFERGFFLAPFQQAVDCDGAIRAYDLPPNITLRELSLRLCAAVAERQASDGYWKVDGTLDVDDEDAIGFAEEWVEEMCWGAAARELNFDDVYWQGRFYIEGHTIVRGTATGGGLVYVCSWGS